MTKTAFINGKVVSHIENFEGIIIVEEGKIIEVMGEREPAKLPENFDGEVVDLKGKYILPGLIDAHVHFRVPGNEEEEDWVTGSKAALAGGVTTVLDMPNNKPSIVDADSLARKRAIVERDAMVNYGFFVGANGENIKEVSEVRNVAGVKLFMGSSTGKLLVDKKSDIEGYLREMGKIRRIVAVHAENEDCINNLKEQFDGIEDPSVHSKIRGPECARDACKDLLHLAKKSNARVHICHVSTAGELEVIRKFKNKNVSCEVTPHHLFLNTDDYNRYGNLIKVNPPVRDPADQVAMWEGVKDGTVDIIATDHAPHTRKNKRLSYSEVASGVPGVQIMLPLLLDAVNKGTITLETVVRLCSYNPARIYGIKNKGQIKVGYDADLTIVDMNLLERLCHVYLWTKVNWSPFHGWILKGFPVMTYVGGELMYQWRDGFGSLKAREVEFE